MKLRRLIEHAALIYTGADYVLSTFHGAWTREMNRSEAVLETGKYVNESFTGTSSSRANPFIMLGRKRNDRGHRRVFRNKSYLQRQSL